MIKIDRINSTQINDYSYVSADIENNGKRIKPWFKIFNSESGNEIDAMLIINVLPAMSIGNDLVVTDGFISPKLSKNIEKIQDIYTTWDPKLFKRINIISKTMVAHTYKEKRGVGSYFTGGVDSFYSLLKNIEEITHIIYVWGLDVKRDNTVLYPKVSKMLSEVAAYYNKALIEVETNIRDNNMKKIYGITYMGYYEPYSVGALLGATGTLLSKYLDKIFIPSSNTYRDLFPAGSHPLTDPLWSSDSIEFFHDGCEANRFKKIKYIVEKDENVLGWLRVCGENRGLTYNCGRCEKCTRTMIALRGLQKLSTCKQFNNELKLWRVMKIDAARHVNRLYLQENLEAIKSIGKDIKLEFALKIALSNIFSWGFWKILRHIGKKLRERRHAQLPDNLRQPG